MDRNNVIIDNNDLKVLDQIVQGIKYDIEKVVHVPSGVIMARKTILYSPPNTIVQENILQELNSMRELDSKYLVSIYGAMYHRGISLCMEYMDQGSFYDIKEIIGPIDIDVVAHVALAVLHGIIYLWDNHRIFRYSAIKPSNILFNRKGEIKLTDFGMMHNVNFENPDGTGGEMHFGGLATYFSPNKISGYDTLRGTKYDIWSLGISLLELALGRYPFPEDESSERGITLMDLMMEIYSCPSPRLSTSRVKSTPPKAFPVEADEFIDFCLKRTTEERKSAEELLVHPWMYIARSSTLDLEVWAASLPTSSLGNHSAGN